MYEKKKNTLMLIGSKIDKIFQICGNTGRDGVISALNDDVRDRPAILMHLTSCEEQIKKLAKADIDVSDVIASDDIAGLRQVRNRIAHDYEGISLEVIEDIIINDLPRVKQCIEKFLNQYEATRSQVKQETKKKDRDLER